jgi:PAS domain S-box-containing protein
MYPGSAEKIKLSCQETVSVRVYKCLKDNQKARCGQPMNVENQKTILLVEDELLVALNQKQALERHGYKVITAKNGEKALEIAELSPEIDLVLMDICLGEGIDGAETAEHIISKRDLPLIFLTSHIEPEIVCKTDNIKSYGYIVKSSGETVLLASVRMALRLYENISFGQQKHSEALPGEEKYRSIFTSVPYGLMVVDRETATITDCNDAAGRMYGYSPDELAGLPVVSLSAEPEETRAVIEIAPACVPLRYHKKKDGTLFPVEVLPVPAMIRDRAVIIGAIRDITEHLDIDSALRESEVKYRMIFENSPVGILITGHDGRVFEANPAACRIMGRTEEEICGLGREQMAVLFEPQVSPVFKDPGTAGKFSEVTGYKRPDGILIPLESVAAVFTDINGELRSGIFFRDITERKMAEEKICSLLREKEILLRETHHRIKNNMHTIYSLLVLQANASNSSGAGDILKNAAGRVQSMVVLYDKLYSSNSPDMLSIRD